MSEICSYRPNGWHSYNTYFHGLKNTSGIFMGSSKQQIRMRKKHISQRQHLSLLFQRRLSTYYRRWIRCHVWIGWKAQQVGQFGSWSYTHLPCINCLGSEFGGLINKKRKTGNRSDDHLFKKPSLLGLDKLAKIKKQENIRQYDQIDRGDSELSESVRGEIRRFVSLELMCLYKNCLLRHRNRDDRNDRRGILADSRDRGRRHDSPDDHRHQRRDDYDRRDRDRHRRGDRSYGRECSNRLDRDSERRRFNEPETPQFKLPSTPSRSAWDEDDEKSWRVGRKHRK